MDLIEQFLSYSFEKKGRFSPKTIEIYKPILREFEAFCKATWEEVRPQHIQHFINRKKGGDSQKNLYRACLSSFFSWLEANDIIPKNPCRGLARYQKEIREETPYYLTEDDYQRMVLACPKTRTGRDYLFILEFLRYTGIQIEETQTIKSVGVDLEKGICTVLSKGNKKRWVPFPLRIKTEIEKKLLKNGRYLFKKTPHQMWYAVKRAAELAEIQEVVRDGSSSSGKRYKISPQSLRQFFASDAIRRGMSETVVKEILGLSRGNTGHYTKDIFGRVLKEYREVYG